MSIFKAYDIRGVVPDQLDTDLARRIGRGAARYLAAERLAVGRDARESSPDLAAALIAGIAEEGVQVVDLGLVSTPMLYFGIEHLGLGGGLMVTASHNPPQYNGFKVCREHAIPVGGDSGLRDIEALAIKMQTDMPTANAPAPAANTERADILDAYLEHLLALTESRPRLRVAIDCANGMAGVALLPLLERLPLDVELLYAEPDGRFPNHEADPLKTENLGDLVEAVRRHRADFGVGFDGDADRAIFVDEHGEPVTSDLVTALIARRRLASTPGARILYDLRSSRATAEEIEAAGGQPEMSRVGHAFIKARMREVDADFAGELSGHMYFRFSPTFFADDGLAAFVAMIDLLGTEQRPLSELLAPLQRYAASGEISSPVRDAAALLKSLAEEHKDADEVSWLDGLLVRYPDWWFNLRPSNTEPLIRLNLEASDRDRMERERDRLLERVASA